MARQISLGFGIWKLFRYVILVICHIKIFSGINTYGLIPYLRYAMGILLSVISMVVVKLYEKSLCSYPHMSAAIVGIPTGNDKFNPSENGIVLFSSSGRAK